jgi:phosphatidylserine/phosphatidylglycerophosphate/cardiolipin synthase-like enzyme
MQHPGKLLGIFLLFGCLVIASAAKAEAVPASGTMEVLFTPWDDAEGAIIRTLAKARHSIHVQTYLLTSRSISNALLDAKAHGVVVEILADYEMLKNGQSSQIPKLAAAGIPVWLETRYAIAHNKIMLIDATDADGAVITGSYNFTWSAQARNAENLLILRGNRSMQRRYLNNWQRHRAEAQPYATQSTQTMMEPAHDYPAHPVLARHCR